MPLYVYKCKACGKVEEAYRSIADRHTGPECHGEMEFQISTPMIAPVLGGGSIPGYQCPVSGEHVTSRRRRREIMKEHNLVEKG